MENRSRTYVALDALTRNFEVGITDEIVQPIELIPFDDKEYQLQLRLSCKHENAGDGNDSLQDIDRSEIVEAVSNIRIDQQLGISDEIIYGIQHITVGNKVYELQVVMTSSNIIKDQA